MISALYCRVSTAEQANEGYSIHEQAERLKSYCSALKINRYKVYSDPAFSGGNMNRPALQEMITDVKAGRINKVIVYKLDRLSRSQLDTLYLIEKVFLANNCDFISISENFDTSSPFGRAMIGILAVFAQLEREQIKERMILGRTARAKEGLFHGGSGGAAGYEYVNGKLIVNEFEAMQIKEAFKLYCSGYGFNDIRKIFEDKGYYTSKEMVDVPIVGKITAGEPILAVENITDTFPIPIDFVGNSESFMLVVRGESMIEAGILDGDYILVKKQDIARNGEIVVALIGEEATVKTFYKEKDHIRLQPENSTMDPIIVPNCKILGKVGGVFRKLS